MLKLFHVLLKVLPRHVNVGPANRQLQTRPKPLDPVNVAIAVNIFSSTMVAMSLSLLKFVGQASLVDEAMLPS